MKEKTTALYKQHLLLNAKMAPFAGYTMPLQYSGVRDEVHAVRKHVGIFDVSHMGEFFIKGNDATGFVDFLLTNDFAGVKIGKALYSPLCNDNGKILDDLIAYKLSDTKVLLCVNASNIEKDKKWIESKAKGFKVDIQDVCNTMSLLAVQGPKTGEILQEIDLIDLKTIPPYCIVQKGEILLARTGYTGEDGVEIFSEHKTIKNLWEILLEKKAVPCGLIARDVLRLEASYPLYGQELTEELTPLETNLSWAVKMNKRDFVGKKALEISSPRYKMFRYSLEKGIPRKGHAVLNIEGRKVGEVTSGIYSPYLKKGIALALVERENIPEDKVFFIQIRDKAHKAYNHKKSFLIGE